MTSSALTATGDQYEITHGGARAVITEVAAALREFSVDGVQLTESYPASAPPPFASGIVLAPWPNRVAYGRWTLRGVTQQLNITEPARENALHGLLRHTAYRVLERTEAAITLGAVVYPQHGYPFLVETSVQYSLTDDGLRVRHAATNHSDDSAPIAFGAHPFFRIGDVPSADLTLTLNAATRFETDDRLNPVAEVAVVGDYDLRNGRRVAQLDLDTTFRVIASADRVVATLVAPDGRTLRLWQDENHGYTQVFTTRDFPKDGGHATAIAVEPMTAAPDAFNSGLGVVWLESGQSWSAEWGVGYTV